MPVHVYEDTLDLIVPVLETIPLNLDAPETFAAYPSLLLRNTGATQTSSIGVAILENAFLKVVVAPSLGGRIIQITDKRTRFEILPRIEAMEVVTEGKRGLAWNHGIEFLAGVERMNALGPVDLRVHEPAEDDQPGGVIMFELGPNLDTHFGVTLHPDRAEIVLDLRVHNRSLQSQPGQAGFRVGGFETVFSGKGDPQVSAYDAARDVGWTAIWKPGEIELAEAVAGGIQIQARQGAALLPARRTEEIKVRLVPHSGLGGLSAASREAAVHLEAGHLRTQISTTYWRGVTFLETDPGQTFEAATELNSEIVSDADLTGLPSPAVGVVLRAADHSETLRLNPGQTLNAGSLRAVPGENPVEESATLSRQVDRLIGPSLDLAEVGQEIAFHSFTRVAGAEGLAHLGDALVAMKARRWADADSSLDKALGFLAEDHLLWWMKAAVRREGALYEQGEERGDLMNAHFLAPMEPVLRAESFLSQPESPHKEPHPLMKPVAASPDAVQDVACLLILCGMTEALARFADEIFRHGEYPMLRLLLADQLIRSTRMDATAQEHLVLAAKAPVQPPFPWRKAEIAAIQHLMGVFPDDAWLAQLARVVQVSAGR